MNLVQSLNPTDRRGNACRLTARSSGQADLATHARRVFRTLQRAPETHCWGMHNVPGWNESHTLQRVRTLTAEVGKINTCMSQFKAPHAATKRRKVGNAHGKHTAVSQRTQTRFREQATARPVAAAQHRYLIMVYAVRPHGQKRAFLGTVSCGRSSSLSS